MFRGSSEDRLNPLAPEGVEDTSLGGYLTVHGRAAAFQGVDGDPYTVAIEAEYAADADPPWVAYLIFLRWAQTGTAIMGHLETGDLVEGQTEEEVRGALESLPLARVKALLDDTIHSKQDELDS